MATAEMNIGAVTQTLTLKVRGIRSLAVRTWVCTKLLRIAAWVLGTRISIEMVGGDDFDEQDSPPAFDSAPHRRYLKVGEYVVPTAASVHEGPLYDSSAHEWGPHVEVLLNGEAQSEVVSFDTEGGWLRRYRRDSEGILFLAGDEVATEVLRGKVELRPR